MGQVFFYSRLDLVENGFPQVESNSKNVCCCVNSSACRKAEIRARDDLVIKANKCRHA